MKQLLIAKGNATSCHFNLGASQKNTSGFKWQAHQGGNGAVANDGTLSVSSPTFFDNAAYVTIGKPTGSSAKLKLSGGATAGGLTLVFNRSSDSISVATLVVEWDSVLRRFANSLSIGTTDIGPSSDDPTIDIDAPSVDKVTVYIPVANAVGDKTPARLKATKSPQTCIPVF
jgi:hypothetical protein